ncbi:FAD-dependent oxidoreductase [Salinivibrio kushneri]|uniref:FAD-dependent oxidoreductase n=1 Tax=Salinivibrio kushneri TaxID=1908198 RepID=A0AA47KLT1_9GAMM|nr:FAD-dependent oxidoreductase [Salinivibrio kushneri]WBA09310.1 FAD-dependent oxidoreductase [Salinivibrio kushneri]
MAQHSQEQTQVEKFRVAVIGGGVAGTTAAMRLAERGVDTQVFEAGTGLVSGPPICHLHAGGNLYRDISLDQCLTLLEQSVATVRMYPHSVNRRPTVLAVPQQDPGSLDSVIARLETLRERYAQLVKLDSDNKVMGEPSDYFRLYQQDELEALRNQDYHSVTDAADQWMWPVAQSLDLSAMKYPLVLVQEYGLSVFRLAAEAQLTLADAPHCQLNFNHKVMDTQPLASGWQVTYKDHTGQIQSTEVDYLINAAGFRTGTIDDMAGFGRERLVEYKAAYIAHWTSTEYHWPEIIVHGQRGTPQGMAQLTPYPDGFFQLHGMTQDVTLFEHGLVKSSAESAQPTVDARYVKNIDKGWDWQEVCERTDRAIDHFARWLPAFKQAEVGGKPLCGAQQIPGDDPSLRASDVSFDGERYARLEIVKASSALTAINKVLTQFEDAGWISPTSYHPLSRPNTAKIIDTACELATRRGYPEALAKPVG